MCNLDTDMNSVYQFLLTHEIKDRNGHFLQLVNTCGCMCALFTWYTCSEEIDFYTETQGLTEILIYRKGT